MLTNASPPLAALAGIINRYLLLDVDSEERLRLLDGCVLVVEVRGTGLEVAVRFGGDGIELDSAEGAAADVNITGSPLALLRLLLSAQSDQGISGLETSMSGDIEVVRNVRNLIARLDIDWEEQLAGVIGDVGAHSVGILARAAESWRQHAQSTLQSNLGEYLEEEARLVPTTGELESYFSGVDRLRDDVERLDQRVERLLGRRMEQSQ